MYYFIRKELVAKETGPSRVYSLRLNYLLQHIVGLAVESEDDGDDTVQTFLETAVYEHLVELGYMDIFYDDDDDDDDRPEGES